MSESQENLLNAIEHLNERFKNISSQKPANPRCSIGPYFHLEPMQEEFELFQKNLKSNSSFLDKIESNFDVKIPMEIILISKNIKTTPCILDHGLYFILPGLSYSDNETIKSSLDLSMNYADVNSHIEDIENIKEDDEYFHYHQGVSREIPEKSLFVFMKSEFFHTFYIDIGSPPVSGKKGRILHLAGDENGCDICIVAENMHDFLMTLATLPFFSTKEEYHDYDIMPHLRRNAVLDEHWEPTYLVSYPQ